MPNAITDHVRGRKLQGSAWLESDERFRVEYRRMRRRVPVYRAIIGGLRLLHRLTADETQKRADMSVRWWPRIGPHGEIYAMPKLWTMKEGDDTKPDPPATEAEMWKQLESGKLSPPIVEDGVRPSGSADELRRNASFAARLARAISADEWPQIIHEYERRKEILKQLRKGVIPEGNWLVETGAVPEGVRPPLFGYARYHWVGDRPLDQASDRLMDEAWVLNRTPPRLHIPWSRGRRRYSGAFFGPMFGELGRTVPGAEANPEFLSLRAAYGVWWPHHASKKNEARVLRGSRVVRAKDLVRFAHTELHWHGLAPEPKRGPAWVRPWEPPRPVEITDEVVTTMARVAKSEPASSPTAQRAPSRDAVAAVVAAHGLAAPLPQRVQMPVRRAYDRKARAGGALDQAIARAVTTGDGVVRARPSRGLPAIDPAPDDRPAGVHPWQSTPGPPGGSPDVVRGTFSSGRSRDVDRGKSLDR
ncbi:hypothetical protein [Embleya sp. NBC_00896]|uniref:hypothetical protein n=1 Tax=Embleya sp. NBC_00896 TaxID=2975961 RepID=UPI00386EDBC3|nr:hypothetical protein OG928_19500 [Embleya sp. NBC_00896]